MLHIYGYMIALKKGIINASIFSKALDEWQYCQYALKKEEGIPLFHALYFSVLVVVPILTQFIFMRTKKQSSKVLYMLVL